MANVSRLSLALLMVYTVRLSTVQAQGDHIYLGCFWDDHVRALPNLTSCTSPCATVCSTIAPYCQTSTMTIEFCVNLCKSKQFKYAGLQAGAQCFCGTSEASFDQNGVAECKKPCLGNSSQICGGDYRNSVYDTLYQVQTCPQPGTITNGMIIGEKSEYFEGDSITYVCEGTTIMLGDPNRTCLSSGTWNNPAPECRVVCNEQLVPMDTNRGVPILVEEFKSNVNVEGERYLLPCLIGYTSPTDSLLATCNGDGTWIYNSTDIACQAVVCPSLVSGEGVLVSGNDFTYSGIVMYTCDVGYTSSSGSVVRECQADGTWSGVDIICNIVTCPPPQVTDGMLITPGPYNFGDVVTYFCRGDGVVLVGNTMRTCTGDGSWSGEPPVCQNVVITTLPNPTTQVITSMSRTTILRRITTLVATSLFTENPTTRIVTQHMTTAPATTIMGNPITMHATTQSPSTPAITQRLTDVPTSMPATAKLATTMKLPIETPVTQHKTTGQKFPPSETSPIVTQQRITDDARASTLLNNPQSSPRLIRTSLKSVSTSPMKSTTNEGFNEKAKSNKSPADFMVLIVIGAGLFSVLLLSIIFTVACVRSPKRGKSQVSKSINFISSKETGSMMDILWPEDISHDSPRSRADSGLPPSDRNSPSSPDDSPDGTRGVVNLGFENDEAHRQRQEDPYHRIDFVAVNETNSVSSVLINSGIMSPAPQTQDDRSSISHSRMNSFQKPDDVESLYAKVDMSKKIRKNNVQRNIDYESEENPLYEQFPTPKLVLPADDNQSVTNGVVKKTSRRTPSDVSVTSRSYWAQYEEQVTRL